MSTDQAVTVQINRQVRRGREAEFEAYLRAFIPQALTAPGHLGVHVIQPTPGVSREYHVVIKFATREQFVHFRDSVEYVQFRAAIQPLLEREPSVEELTGLESWLTLPAHGLQPLPRWKMALVTLLGVYPTSLLIVTSLGPWMDDWPHWLRSLCVAVLMVGMLTWLVMPLMTRVLRPWLYPQEQSTTPAAAKGAQP